MGVGGGSGVQENIIGGEEVKELREQRIWWVVHMDAKVKQDNKQNLGVEKMTVGQILVFNE